MPRKRKQPTQVAKPDDTFGEMTFPTIGAEEAPAEKPAGVTVEALQERIAALNARLDQRETEMMTHLTTPVIPQVLPQVKPLDFSTLPDPVTNPVEYGQALATQIQANFEAKNALERANQQQGVNRNQKLEVLWDDFANAYPDIAEDTENIEYITHKVKQQAQKRGVDLDRYMFGTPQKFMDDLAKQYNQMFGDDEEPSRKPARQADADPPQRTSVFGGIESGGRPSGSKPEAGQTDMIKDMHAIQQKSGFF